MVQVNRLIDAMNKQTPAEHESYIKAKLETASRELDSVLEKYGVNPVLVNKAGLSHAQNPGIQI